ncbi:hypothetical protein [Rhodococcus sp. JVH1]|uniref:hypothetical protein n=1 Tax=Rhodococcus sp. JVH1 TaxID=745408 RepID=UPI0012F69CC5|nr:hypothetical protein [Rhodococcus sp. JVH1]
MSAEVEPSSEPTTEVENQDWIATVGHRPKPDFVPEFGAELAEITVGACTPGNASAVRVAKTIRADLVALMSRAHKGSVRRGQNGDLDEYEYPVSIDRDPIGELRHPTDKEKHIGTWQYRIYFGAPSEDTDVLVWLLPGRKQSSKYDPNWFVVQNGHIASAKDRMARWRTEWAARRFP